jgi:hypothetical protein
MSPEMFDPSPARRGLDALLLRYPFFDVLKVERGNWNPEVSQVTAAWILVTLGQPSENEIEAFARWEFAIWKNTGAVYAMAGPAGPVSDDPIIEVEHA